MFLEIASSLIPLLSQFLYAALLEEACIMQQMELEVTLITTSSYLADGSYAEMDAVPVRVP